MRFLYEFASSQDFDSCAPQTNGHSLIGNRERNSNDMTLIKKAIASDDIDLLTLQPLFHDDQATPYLIVGNDAFAIRTLIIKPLSQRNIPREEPVLNYGLSRARIVENAFAILANRHVLYRMGLASNNMKDMATCLISDDIPPTFPQHMASIGLVACLSESHDSVTGANDNSSTFRQYLNYFRSPSKIIQKELDNTGYHREATAWDFWYFHFWEKIQQNKGLKEPIVVTPHLIQHMIPQTKFIVIFRNPTERLFSHYFFNDKGPKTADGFHTAVNSAIKKFRGCLSFNSMRSCLFNNTLLRSLPTKVNIGAYAMSLKEWLSVFPRDQFLIFRTEDYQADIRGHIERVFNFLDVAPLSAAEMERIADFHKVHVTARKADHQMLNETRNLLNNFYATFNKDLAEILGDYCFSWSEIVHNTTIQNLKN
ncbi:hypothetical protein ScPMuIL_006981 [Solemya velum]